MEGKTLIKRARHILRENFIGSEELNSIANKMGIFLSSNLNINTPPIPFSEDYLLNLNDEYILILGNPLFKDQSSLTIVKMRNHLGWDPNVSEPCFYNQDWYLRESFANVCTLEPKWYLVRKKVIEQSRGVDINAMLTRSKRKDLHSALLLAYTFFCAYFIQDICLWQNDFIWCNDLDHKGDRIYVGRYKDRDGINKNGFSVHRHLSITNEYGIL